MIFPITSRVNGSNHLEIGGCDLVDLARAFGTPLYVFDDAHLRARAQEIRAAFESRWSPCLPLYATKAYFSPYIARLCIDMGFGIEVTSEGELELARRVDFPRDRIYLHGNNKTATEIRAALVQGVQHVIIDNLDEIDLLARMVVELKSQVRVLLRLAPAIDPHTHKYLATGITESKFGLSLASGDALRAASRVARLEPQLHLVGLHVHLGSQISSAEAYRQAVDSIIDFAAELRQELGFKLEEVDLGGGWLVAYREEEQALAPDSVAQMIVDELRSRISRADLNSKPLLLIEPGRALVAQSAVALYTIGAVKQSDSHCTYVSVDGGMGDNIRPALYGARYTANIANKASDAPRQRVAIAGRYCEQGDILIVDVALPNVAAGDLLAIPVSGAYQLPMASNYNLIPRPAVIAVRDGSPRLIRRRETINDLLGCDLDDLMQP